MLLSRPCRLYNILAQLFTTDTIQIEENFFLNTIQIVKTQQV